jgi:hypothetical protein
MTAAAELLTYVQALVVGRGTDATQSTLDDLAVIRAQMSHGTYNDDECASFLLGMLDDIG